MLCCFLSGTYSVQNASFQHLTNSNSVKITCYFAINAAATRCLATFHSPSSGARFNCTVHGPHHPDLLESSEVCHIPQENFYQGLILQGLTNAVFDVHVEVYDMDIHGEITARPAFKQEQVLAIEINIPKPTPTPSGEKTIINSHVTMFQCVKLCAETTASLLRSLLPTMEQNSKCQCT